MFGLVDNAHSAASDLADDPIVAQNPRFEAGAGTGCRSSAGQRAIADGCVTQLGKHRQCRDEPADLLGELGVAVYVIFDFDRIANLDPFSQLFEDIVQRRVTPLRRIRAIRWRDHDRTSRSPAS